MSFEDLFSFFSGGLIVEQLLAVSWLLHSSSHPLILYYIYNDIQLHHSMDVSSFMCSGDANAADALAKSEV